MSQRPTLDGGDRRTALSCLCGGDDAGLREPGLLHELFERQAEVRPSQPALVFGSRRLTYAQVESRANQLARFLRAHGVARGQCVGVLLDRSFDLYVALLGILKAGGAYVPLDPDYPPARIAGILDDCSAALVLTQASLAHRCADARRVVALDQQGAEIFCGPDTRLTARECEIKPEDLSYVVYTSGSTGRPKGVQIEHRSAHHLVRAESKIFQVRPEDRVFQGFSVAFDASVEEMWLAFQAGATLVPGPPDVVHSGAALAQFLTEAKVTVFSCVPTLLSLLEAELPTVRLLILGGEVCSPELVIRWWQPSRRLFNTYGPTEATVIATYSECHPDRPVTIGRPLPNYSAYVLDEMHQPVPRGATGELYLGGVGLARGYLGRPDLTADRFLDNPFAGGRIANARLYRTGDRVRVTPDGELEFLGRMDDQVKLRGFRIELSEIESVLQECPGVLAGAVTVREEVPGVQQLVAYLVPRNHAPLEEDRIRNLMRARLPGYMVPAWFEPVAELPTLPSGKVDRKRLPTPQKRDAATCPSPAAPSSAREQRILHCWRALFAPNLVSRRDDFFLDLGGHSLLAARMVSELRKEPAFDQLSVLDVYQNPTAESLAAKLDTQTSRQAATTNPPAERAAEAIPHAARRTPHSGAAESLAAKLDTQTSRQAATTNPPRSSEPAPVAQRPAPAIPHSALRAPHLRHAWCATLQGVGLYFVLGFFALQWLAPYLTYTWLVENGAKIIPAILAGLGLLAVLYPLMVMATIALKWLVIGRYRPGRYPLWGWYYWRWWFVNAVQSAVPIEYMAGSPWLNWYARLMGARIGRNVHLGTDSICIFDLVSVGDESCIGTDASLAGYTVQDGWLVLGPIQVGRRCFVGTRAVLREGTALADDARLEDLSLLPSGCSVPAGETWSGSPAQPAASAKRVPPAASAPAQPSLWRRLGFAAVQALGLFLFPLFVVVALFPGVIGLNYLYRTQHYAWVVAAAPVVAVSFVLLLSLEIVALKWILLGRVRPGRYSLQSFFYLRKWFVDQLLELSLDVLGPLYSTIYLAPWYRALGAKLGRRAEISTASFISPDLLEVGEESFIADCVSLGAARVEAGCLTIAPARIGQRSFIGNSALLPPGAVVGDHCLIGCLSTVPSPLEAAARPNTSWLGSPAFLLPQREPSAAFSAEQTFQPSRKLWCQRGLIEFFRVTLPSTCFVIFSGILLTWVLHLHAQLSTLQLVLLFPVLYAVCGVGGALFVVLLKWLLMGRYHPREVPLWHPFVWRTELITALHENFANPFLIGMLEGTPYVAWFFRLLGSRIGRRVWMNTTQLTEFDLVDIGDDAALNDDSTIQTHLFEDRVMKMSHIRIAPKCTVGSLSLVLYDTNMEEGATLNDLSLLMKGETLPAGTAWEGIPARSARPLTRPPIDN